MYRPVAALGAALIACALAPAAVSAHPIEEGEIHVPWTDKLSERSWLLAGEPAAPEPARGTKAAGARGAGGLSLVGNADKDNTTNSDLAFWGNLVYAGHYGGFRILDATADQPRVVVDHVCNGPQNDVSVYEMGGKRFLFQSVDTAQTAEDCSSANAPIVNGGRVGYEGVRVFDVTDPAKPQFIDMIQTACGSHTHSIVPAGQQAYIYVASYPLGIEHHAARLDAAERRLPVVRDAAQEDLDHQGLGARRDVPVRAQGAAAERRHGVQPRLPGVP